MIKKYLSIWGVVIGIGLAAAPYLAPNPIKPS
jgi:hypothetical protein